MEEEKQMLRKLVDESLEKAIDKLKERLNPKSSPYKGVLNHSAGLKKLEEDARNGLCSDKEYSTRENNLRNKVLDIINALDEEDFNETNLTNVHKSTTKKKSEKSNPIDKLHQKSDKINKITPKEFENKTICFKLHSDIPDTLKDLEQKIKMNHSDFFPDKDPSQFNENDSLAYFYIIGRTKALKIISQQISTEDNKMDILNAIKNDLKEEIDNIEKILDSLSGMEHRVLKDKIINLEKAISNYISDFKESGGRFSHTVVSTMPLLMRIKELGKFLKDITISNSSSLN